MDSSVSSEQTDVTTNKKALMSSESEQAQGVESSVEEDHNNSQSCKNGSSGGSQRTQDVWFTDMLSDLDVNSKVLSGLSDSMSIQNVPHECESKENPCSGKSQSTPGSQPMSSGSLNDRYISSMVLSAIGDAMGYYSGKFEFRMSGPKIHEIVTNDLGGLDKLEISSLITSARSDSTDADHVLHQLAKDYMACRADMDGRAPGDTTLSSLPLLKPFTDKGYRIAFSSSSGGCGAAMRAMCIGLRYHSPSDLPELIRISVESGRMTHHHPTGYLGSLTSALFTSYAIQDKPLHQWGHDLMLVMNQVKEYIKTTEHCVKENIRSWTYFHNSWTAYLALREISDGTSLPVFTHEDEVEFRDNLHSSWSWHGWGGASGHDSVMIAYDALLGCAGSWNELCRRGVLHGGDNDSTGAIAGAWYGALYGGQDVNKLHYHKLEYLERLCDLGQQLYDISHST